MQYLSNIFADKELKKRGKNYRDKNKKTFKMARIWSLNALLNILKLPILNKLIG